MVRWTVKTTGRHWRETRTVKAPIKLDQNGLIIPTPLLELNNLSKLTLQTSPEMEIQFQQAKRHKRAIPSGKAGGKSRTGNKFVGVRQRQSGRWVAEIKDTSHTSQKIRMWLGTFETAEAAARAYDEAACLLRGQNTRTNFITQVSLDSPLASRIRNIINSRKGIKQDGEDGRVPNPIDSNSATSTDNSNWIDLSNLREELEYYGDASKSSNSWGFNDVLDLPKNVHFPNIAAEGMEFNEFERMNGIQECRTEQDCYDDLWDLQPLCSLVL